MSDMHNMLLPSRSLRNAARGSVHRPASTLSLRRFLCDQAITMRHGVAAEQLRVYLHYQPSYYHLHVHFVHVKHDAGMGMAVGKAHLLSEVISESLPILCLASWTHITQSQSINQMACIYN